MSWVKSRNLEYNRTGEFFKAKIGVKNGEVGELVNVLSWGGLILEFINDDNESQYITFAASDVEGVSDD